MYTLYTSLTLRDVHPVHRPHISWCTPCTPPSHFVMYTLYTALILFNACDKYIARLIAVKTNWNSEILTGNLVLLLRIFIIIIINVKDWTLWSVPSPELQQLAPTILRSSNCSLSLWSVVIWFQKGIRFCGILCKCESQFRLYSSILSSILNAKIS